MDIAFADITDFVEFGNSTYTDGETQEEIQYSYVNLKNSNSVDGTLISEVSKGRDGAKIKLADRMKALEWLSNYFEINPADKHRRAFENRKLEIELLKLESQIKDTDTEEELKDNFIDAMNATAQEVWGDSSDDRTEDQQPPG